MSVGVAPLAVAYKKYAQSNWNGMQKKRHAAAAAAAVKTQKK